MVNIEFACIPIYTLTFSQIKAIGPAPEACFRYFERPGGYPWGKMHKTFRAAGHGAWGRRSDADHALFRQWATEDFSREGALA